MKIINTQSAPLSVWSRDIAGAIALQPGENELDPEVFEKYEALLVRAEEERKVKTVRVESARVVATEEVQNGTVKPASTKKNPNKAK